MTVLSVGTVILGILKWVLLVVLAVILALLIVLLACPVTYQADGQKEGEKINARVKAAYLFGLLRFRLLYDRQSGKGAVWSLRIAGHALAGNEPENPKKKKRRTKGHGRQKKAALSKKEQQYRRHSELEIEPAPETQTEPVMEAQTETVPAPETETTAKTAADTAAETTARTTTETAAETAARTTTETAAETAERETSSAEKTGETRKKKREKSARKKHRKTFQEIIGDVQDAVLAAIDWFWDLVDKILDAPDRIEEIWEEKTAPIRRYKQMWDDYPEKEKTYREVKWFVIHLIKPLLPRQLQMDLLVGTGDPYSSAQILGYGSALLTRWMPRQTPRRYIQLDADFENKVADFTAALKGHFTLGHIAFIVVTAWCHKRTRRLIKTIAHLIKESKRS